jgi:uncharacterized Zn-finger protein
MVSFWPSSQSSHDNTNFETKGSEYSPSDLTEDGIILKQQAPNFPGTWSHSQQQRATVQDGARFLGANLARQPRPLAAIDLIEKLPIVAVNSHVVSCDGGGVLGHPRIYINLVRA